MGLSVTLSNALSGMHVNQRGLEVVSRNVANAGTPGYHKQSLTIVEQMGTLSPSARAVGVTRAFSTVVAQTFSRQLSEAGHADVRATYLDRLQNAFGMPGDAHSLDTAYQNFESALQALTISPEDPTARAQVMGNAQALADTLNRLSSTVQEMRLQTESEIASHVSDLNRKLGALADVNNRLRDQGVTDGARAALLDERDRLVTGISELIDIRVDYRPDDTVALSTISGVGLLDHKPSLVSFEGAGGMSATSLFSLDDAESSVGKLTITSPAGLTFDLVKQNTMQSGRLAALVEMRDRTLVEAQHQLDDIAASLALALSSAELAGTATSDGGADGFEIDLGGLQSGNSFTLGYVDNGVPHTVRVVRVDDPAHLPMDHVDANGVRVVGLDFSAGVGAAAAALNGLLGPNVNVDNPSGDVLRVLDDGAGGPSAITGLDARITLAGMQGEGLGLSLFVDNGNAAFTDSLDGPGQRLGFAGRIRLNPAVVVDDRLLVQYQAGGSLGDAARAEHLLGQLRGASFTSDKVSSPEGGRFRLNGTVGAMIGQVLNHQGAAAEAALSNRAGKVLALETLAMRMDDDFGVNMDEEMARLMELQNAYAANARVVSIVQELIRTLMQI